MESKEEKFRKIQDLAFTMKKSQSLNLRKKCLSLLVLRIRLNKRILSFACSNHLTPYGIYRIDDRVYLSISESKLKTNKSAVSCRINQLTVITLNRLKYLCWRKLPMEEDRDACLEQERISKMSIKRLKLSLEQGKLSEIPDPVYSEIWIRIQADKYPLNFKIPDVVHNRSHSYMSISNSIQMKGFRESSSNLIVPNQNSAFEISSSPSKHDPCRLLLLRPENHSLGEPSSKIFRILSKSYFKEKRTSGEIIGRDHLKKRLSKSICNIHVSFVDRSHSNPPQSSHTLIVPKFKNIDSKVKGKGGSCTKVIFCAPTDMDDNSSKSFFQKISKHHYVNKHN